MLQVCPEQLITNGRDLMPYKTGHQFHLGTAVLLERARADHGAPAVEPSSLHPGVTCETQVMRPEGNNGHFVTVTFRLDGLAAALSAPPCAR